ncbi:MAG: hydroxysqualene dehydroxylase HpnE [Bryobacteraceae bacterium]
MTAAPQTPRAIVVGGGLAGLASAAALARSGYQVDVLESRAFPGGRATSYPAPGDDTEHIDNCQHVLLRCCTGLLDFYERLGVRDAIEFHRTFYFLEPGGRLSVLERGRFPPPLHFAESFARMRFLSWTDKLSIALAMSAIEREWPQRDDLDSMTMLAWLREKSQPPRAIERFWRQVLVSAVNEELDRMAASHGLQVFAQGFLSSGDAYEMGIPRVPLAQLYSPDAWRRFPGVKLHFRSPAEQIKVENGRVVAVSAAGVDWCADVYVSAVPFERAAALVPALGLDFTGWEHSPITGVHLWFDRPVTDLPHATLLDRTMQWMFNKRDGRYLQLVVSASRGLTEMPRGEVIDLARRELAEFLPKTAEARIEKAHVVKEVRATYSARPGLEALRPPARTAIPNLFLAGDWTRTGWPATMEGAVRSGYLAAQAITETGVIS